MDHICCGTVQHGNKITISQSQTSDRGDQINRKYFKESAKQGRG